MTTAQRGSQENYRMTGRRQNPHLICPFPFLAENRRAMWVGSSVVDHASQKPRIFPAAWSGGDPG